MRIPAWFLLFLFTFWNSAELMLVYKDMATVCIAADQEENIPQGETEPDSCSETYFHDISLFSEMAWNLNYSAHYPMAAAYSKSFYKLLSLPTFFTPPEV